MRRLRGVLGTALTWAFVWSLTTPVWVAWMLSWRPRVAIQLHGPPQGALVFLFFEAVSMAIAGAIGGAVFAIVLSVVEGRARSLDVLSIRRTGAWGVLGGLALPLLIGATVLSWREMVSLDNIMALAYVCVLGAISAAGSLALARRAPAQFLGAEPDTNLQPDTV